jgi:hypothetical protein
VNAASWSVPAVGVLSVALLSGCLGESDRQRQAPVARLSAVAQFHAVQSAMQKGASKVALRIHADERADSTATSFQRVVWHLQSLGYLPIVHGFVRGGGNTKARHDAFLWPVPAALQKTVDQFAWNAQNPFIRGAIIQFERANGGTGLAAGRLLGPRGVSEGRLHENVVRAILSTSAKPDPFPWQWVYVTKADGTKQPESLHLWERGQGYIWHTRVNTGVLGSTPNGTWPIYQRLPSTTMHGVFPVPVSPLEYAALKGQQVPQWTGSTLMQPERGLVKGHQVRWRPYNDPGIKWVNYFDDGRGIHYYPRASYGFPQSAGCVEEPRKAAKITYGLLHYGVPVTVSKSATHFKTLFPAGAIK